MSLSADRAKTPHMRKKKKNPKLCFHDEFTIQKSDLGVIDDNPLKLLAEHTTFAQNVV